MVLAVVIACFAMTGCVTNDVPVSDVAGFCDNARPIYIGRADVLTDKTADQILAHNLVGSRLCDWGRRR